MSAACLLYRTRDPFGTDPPAFPPCRTWPILSKVSNKSQKIHDSDMELIMQRASFYSLHSSFFSYNIVFHCLGCAAGGMGSYLSLPRVLILGMLLPLADSSLLNSAQLLIKKKKKKKGLGPGLVTEGTEHLCIQAEPEPHRLGGRKPLCTPRQGNNGCRERNHHLLCSKQGSSRCFVPVGLTPGAQGPVKGRLMAHGPARTKTAKRIKQPLV